MHVALVYPFSSGPGRGNITTVRRIAASLSAAGWRVTSIPLDTATEQEQTRLLAAAQPQLLHAFHAFYAGPAAARHARMLGIPYLLTITGSDLFNEEMRNAPETRAALTDAAQITCFDASVASYLITCFPEMVNKTVVVPQGVRPLPVTGEDTRLRPVGDHAFVILLPAAIRPVKGILEALEALQPLADTLPRLRLVLAGGVLDTGYAAEVKKRVDTFPWAHMAGDVPHELMGALYASANMVLNYSVFEGGMPNALLEAMALGIPVAARDVTGNRSLIHHGTTGWLFSTAEELRDIVLGAMARPEYCAAIGRSARAYVLKHFSPLQETAKLGTLYRKLLQLQ